MKTVEIAYLIKSFIKQTSKPKACFCYNEGMNKKKIKISYINKYQRMCPVCKKHYFKEANVFEICPICNWEDDPSQRKDINLKGGANKLSLKEAIEAYKNEE